MDEEVMMMTTTTMIGHRNLRNPATCEEPMTSTADCRSWKLYENPFFYPQPCFQGEQCPSDKTHLHRLRLPLSGRKIGPFFSDLTSELDLARTQIAELKSELESERMARKKAEALSQTLAGELAEERRRREETERLCDELAGKISSGKPDIDRRELKISEFGDPKQSNREDTSPAPAKIVQKCFTPARLVLGEKWSNPITGSVSPAGVVRRASAEAENPHIRRGIKGFVEFPRVMRAVGSKSRQWGSKLECQKAQLRILLKQKSSIGSSNNLIIT